MEPEVRERFERIEAILHEIAVRHKAAEERMGKAEQKWDKRFEATRKLVEAGIGIVNKLGKRQLDLEKAHKAFLDSFRKGNGNGRPRG
jgi:hypothetical protein